MGFRYQETYTSACDRHCIWTKHTANEIIPVEDILLLRAELEVYARTGKYTLSNVYAHMLLEIATGKFLKSG